MERSLFYELSQIVHHSPQLKGCPTHIRDYINTGTFVQLLAGTVGIFLLSVLFWKTGQFLRARTRHRVLQEGKQTTSRFARTWYGWVPLETHERNKSRFRKAFRYILDWFSWESRRTSYEWVWWDPGCEARDERRARRKRLRLLPRFLQSTEFTPAFSAAYPRSSVECHGALMSGNSGPNSQEIRPASEWETAVNAWSQPAELFDGRSNRATKSIPHHKLQSFPEELTQRRSSPVGEGARHPGARDNASHLTLPSKIHSVSSSANGRRDYRRNDMWQLNRRPRIRHLSLASFESENTQIAEYDGGLGPALASHTRHDCSSITSTLSSRRSHRPMRRYSAWSAKMQIGVRSYVEQRRKDSSGPPGTPATAVWTTSRSEQSIWDLHQAQMMILNRASKSTFENTPVSMAAAPGSKLIERQITLTVDHTSANSGRFNTAPVRFRPPRKPKSLVMHTSNELLHSWHGMRGVSPKDLTVHVITGPARRSTRLQATPNCRRLRRKGREKVPLPTAKLSDWELRLIDQLNRKVKWVYDEMTPGHRPYQFSLLANHWLNTATWVVTDPVSRVSTDYRRRWGDPRFPLPGSSDSGAPRSKYAKNRQRRARIPRIDSWRIAVNRQRKVSGNRHILHSVELYEESAEEPPDGHTDPAAWMLPKPPQGHAMSNKQKNAWYNGGAGWQEKLEDWQQVGPGYRLDKFIHEGRANRTRVREVASSFQRGCRAASLALLARERARSPT
ncbi:Uncharacterized protein PECH_004708 [Penicillium ucsense]|uniref:Uncharacterized protein n=1 Tax=Penicillium ucsense TaxID=2839758 RepID=A0A8J8WLD7_9EURO|nr:Uncharacterized protein PECM_004614 [Penicillium ucsense]KAF7736902.1 Uncharacterized protein PECH_004708 [Penicillium ucsense]